ncbi:MAG: hypothetical protein GC162_04590 [Planctomycetes bacterium]|nr:hypothetical protein [Planctomycetota bacterium]
MRLFADTLLALTLIAVLGGVVVYQREQGDHLQQVVAVQQAIHAIESQCLYRAAVGDVPASNRGYAMHVEPAWFDHRPLNALFGHQAMPWIDHVDEADRELFNPQRIVADGKLAAFWYNPYRGLIRARVPMQLSQESTLETYNLVNGTSLRIEDVDWSDTKFDHARLAARRDARKHKVTLIDDPQARAPSAPPSTAAAETPSIP